MKKILSFIRPAEPRNRHKFTIIAALLQDAENYDSWGEPEIRDSILVITTAYIEQSFGLHDDELEQINLSDLIKSQS